MNTTEVLQFLSGPVTVAAGAAIWKTADWWIKKSAERREAKDKADAELEKQRIAAAADSDKREDDTLRFVLDGYDKRLSACEEKHSECEERVKALSQRVDRVERRSTPVQPMEAAFLAQTLKREDDEG